MRDVRRGRYRLMGSDVRKIFEVGHLVWHRFLLLYSLRLQCRIRTYPKVQYTLLARETNYNFH